MAGRAESAGTGNDKGRIVQAPVKLITPKDGKDKRVARPLDEVSCSMFIPDDVEVLRGAVFNPFYEDTVHQEHWRTAVRHWDFALIGTNLFRVKNDEIRPTVLNCLQSLSSASGRPEVKHLPLCVLGMSIGAGLTTRIVEAVPDRVIAAGPVCLEVGPRDTASRRVPMITIFGERDGRQMEILRRKLPEARADDAQWAIAVQWRRRHEWHRANNLIMPLFHRAIQYRCPSDRLPLDGPVQLAPYDPAAGWLGDLETWRSDRPVIASVTSGTIDARQACWLPDRYLAAVWQAFVVPQPRLRIVQPSGQGDGKPFEAYRSNSLLAARISVDEGVRAKRFELFDGDRKIGQFRGEPLTCSLDGLEPGIHALIAAATLEDDEVVLSHPNTIMVVDSR